MAKKTPVKKSRRRLKRSVRRSLAAVLMITSIAVAAIPVPENYAEAPDDLNGGGAQATTAGGERHDPTDNSAATYSNGTTGAFQYGEGTEDIVSSKVSKLNMDVYSALNINKGTGTTLIEDVQSELYSEKNPSGKVYLSMKIASIGNDWDLGWEFMYYEQTNPRSNETQGVICQYNSQYSADTVDLSLTPYTGYYIVTEEQLSDYFAGVTLAERQAATTGFTYGGTNSLNKMNTKGDPNREITYSYNDYVNDTFSDSTYAQDLYFLTEYYADTYNAKTAAFQKYQTDKAAYDKAVAAGSTTAVDPGNPPATLTVKPSEVLNATQKLKYYCDYDALLSPQGSGYTLVSVIDSRITNDATVADPGNISHVYVAYGGTPISGASYCNDENGFLVTDLGKKMCAIGENAFAGVENVNELTLPSQIGYIADSAFESSFIKRINIDSVVQIGDRAFKGCRQLEEVNFNNASGTKIIGTECFAGSSITSITLPAATTTIGYGAFSKCKQLTTVNLNTVKQDCTIGDFAFYDCSALTDVQMKDAPITSIGVGAFAVDAGASPMHIELPSSLQTGDSLGDWMFANRAGLEYVVFPQNYGRGTTATQLPKNLFHGCINLQYVEFPSSTNDPYACATVLYDMSKDKEPQESYLFTDVVNSDFYVRGPEKNGNQAAYPRQSTWYAISNVNDFVPYVFKNSAGVDCYEVGIGGYLYQANAKGELTSCTVIDDKKVSGDLVIPSKVGNYKITSIASGCFDDEDLRDTIETIEIQDNSVTAIGEGVFKELPNLEKVIIGNSVSSIGDSAFEGCKKLIDVTFHTPSAGYSAFTIGTDAFKTGSDELTFHGDIVEGYAPFDWAMDPDNIIQQNDNGNIRVCYKSIITEVNSDGTSYSLDNLTVMYNPITDMVTLLDYPKYQQISQILNDAHETEIKAGKYGNYENMMVQRWYSKYSGTDYDDERAEFAALWYDALRADDVSAAKDAAYASEAYGPWVTAGNHTSWQDWLKTSTTTVTSTTSTSSTDSGPITGASSVIDLLFEPIVAYADDDPLPYYEKYPYDPVENIASNDVYRAPTVEEQDLVYATKNIVVPQGVESIDVYGYINNLTADGEVTQGKDRNTGNFNTYLNKTLDSSVLRMYKGPSVDADDEVKIVPGLFSGYYVDYTEDSDSEVYKRGNDLVTTVTMNSVKYLPDYAFDSCERLQSVILGADCADIGTAPFRGCYSLTTVGNNDYYTTENGIVYSVNTDGSYTIEECLSARGNLVGDAEVGLSTDPNLASVTAIQAGAFEDCNDVNVVDLSSATGLTTIPENCFKDCDDLTEVSLPRSVNYIEEGAFANDLELKSLTIPGNEVHISAQAFEANPEKSWTTVYTYEDSSAARYVDDYGSESEYKLKYKKIGDEWRVIFLDADGQQVGDEQYVADGGYATPPTLPEVEGWTFEKWLGTNNKEITDKITENTIFVAKGYYDNGMVNGKYKVEFYDQVDGTKIGETQWVEPGKAAIAPQAPTHTGYSFQKWSSDEYLDVQGNLTIMAMYSGSGTGSGTSGGSTSGSSTSGGGSGSASGSSGSTSGSGTDTTSSSTSGSSTSTSSSSTTGTYTVTVENGSGSGTYAVGSTVVIAANTPATGMVFSKWTTESNGVTLASVSMSATTFVMPANNVTVTANYVAGSSTTATPVSTSGTSGTNDGNTRVDITKPGISNKDLATANVNGSTDNFVIKIAETDAATQAVQAALTNKYGSLDSILYYAMDITLWDSTGTYQITDANAQGLTVDITIPIPDSLVAYGGNNKAGAVINDNQLESLNENFTTINGVPCIRFTATHFSPYTVYVDTNNLTEGMLDTTPKTGDPIHPKWFLSIGLACLSIILFMKKDKNVKVKTA